MGNSCSHRGQPRERTYAANQMRRSTSGSPTCSTDDDDYSSISPEWVPRTLERIGLIGPGQQTAELRPDVSSLGTLQAAFLRHVPFENQCIHEGVPLDMSLAAVYSKVVEQKLGGLCFEVNSFFCELLVALGFSAYTAAGSMYLPSQVPQEPADNHMTVMVNIDGEQFLVDVGNGCDLGAPVPLSGSYTTAGEVSPPAGPATDTVVTKFGIGPVPNPSVDKHTMALLVRLGDEGDENVRFSFTPEPRDRESFSAPVHFTQTSPDSIFTKNRLATLRTETGRITLAGSRLITTVNGSRQITEVGGLDQQKKVLASSFGLRY